MVSARIAHSNLLVSEYWWTFALFLLMSSIVIADSKLRLDFPDEFYSQSIDTKLKRAGQQAVSTDNNEQKWRKSASSAPIDVRWKSKSVYEENRHLAPLVPGVRHSSQTRQALDINPQLELRF